MIQINQMYFAYKKDIPLFENLSLEINSGGIYGLLGKNGAGKTSLIKIISGLLFPHNGNVNVLGFNPPKRSPLFLSQLILLPEEFDLPPMSIKRYEEVFSSFYPDFDKDKFKLYLAKFDLDSFVLQNMNTLSYGQKKKALLSFAFASNTKLLLLDEPTNGLDIPSKAVFRKLCIEASDNDKVFIISTHQVKDVERLLDQIIIIDKGKIVSNQSINEISQTYKFEFVDSLDNISFLYSEQMLDGYKIITDNSTNEPSQIDIELYFNAIINKNK